MTTSPQSDAERLAEIRAREQAATPGPWRHGTNPPFEDGPDWSWGDVVTVAERETWLGPRSMRVFTSEDPPENESDLDFIVHAREDIPWLLDRIAALSGSGSGDSSLTSEERIIDGINVYAVHCAGDVVIAVELKSGRWLSVPGRRLARITEFPASTEGKD